MGREEEAILPATPQACIELAELEGELAGKLVAVVGRGQTVGRPLISMLINRSATVTVCHTRTPDLTAALASCGVVIVAAGKAALIGSSHVNSHHIVIDAGINVVD
jgi:methylenetetrahydrofolate dehydrogenase (NADP+)/methenyltetrahydrofolate cyclohydrolase